ncbi:MAG: hypothetical protein HQ471_09175 [Flavobacteriales bacterium]|jgi:hypothetical protein|nr:hypothetical protein [Flavobacteriales bacterium]
MELLSKITDWTKGLFGLLAALLGLGVFAELLFGSFLGGFSVIGNIINVVGQFGDKGFVGLLAFILVVLFIEGRK